jgi:hypothetical protein
MSQSVPTAYMMLLTTRTKAHRDSTHTDCDSSYWMLWQGPPLKLPSGPTWGTDKGHQLRCAIVMTGRQAWAKSRLPVQNLTFTERVVYSAQCANKVTCFFTHLWVAC